MGMFFQSLPPEFYQEHLYCWAAGGASWLRATNLGNATPQQLIERFGGYLNTDGTLPEGSKSDDPTGQQGGMQEVFKQLGVHLENIPRSKFTYAYVLDKLKRKGHLLLLEGVGGDMGHTYVVYGVGYPSDDNFSVFDSLQGGGYRNRSFKEIAGQGNLYVGWAAWAGKT